MKLVTTSPLGRHEWQFSNWSTLVSRAWALYVVKSTLRYPMGRKKQKRYEALASGALFLLAI